MSTQENNYTNMSHEELLEVLEANQKTIAEFCQATEIMEKSVKKLDYWVEALINKLKPILTLMPQHGDTGLTRASFIGGSSIDPRAIKLQNLSHEVERLLGYLARAKSQADIRPDEQHLNAPEWTEQMIRERLMAVINK